MSVSTPISRQVTPRKRSIDDILNRTLDRNIPKKPMKTKRETDIQKFDKETKKLYYEFCEKQRQEMAIFERNYFLDNIDQIDDDANFQQVPDLEQRKKLEQESIDIKHTFNMRKEELSKKLRKEETKFWTQRNAERAKLLQSLDENALHGFSLRPRSVSSSPVPSPVRSRDASPQGTPYNSRCRTPTSRSYTNTRYSLPPAFPRYEKPKSPTGFFLPKCTSLSRQNKIGIFPKKGRSNLRYSDDFTETEDMDLIRSKVNKTSAITTPKRKNRPNLTVDTGEQDLFDDQTMTLHINEGEEEKSEVEIPSLTAEVDKVLQK